MNLMYGPVTSKTTTHTLPLHLRGTRGSLIPDKNNMYMETCRELGISCYQRKIQVQGFGSRAFVLCWPLVSHIYSTHALNISMLQHTPLLGARSSEYSFNINVPRPSSTTNTRDGPLVVRHSSLSLFVHLSSQSRMPLGLVHTHIPGTMQLDNVTLAPDSSAIIFVVLPVHARQHTSMQVVLSTRCGRDTGKKTSAQQPFFHSCIMHLTKAATPDHLHSLHHLL